MDRCLSDDKPLSEPMMAYDTDAYITRLNEFTLIVRHIVSVPLLAGIMAWRLLGPKPSHKPVLTHRLTEYNSINTKILYQENAFENSICQISPILSRLYCVFYVIRCWFAVESVRCIRNALVNKTYYFNCLIMCIASIQIPYYAHKVSSKLPHYIRAVFCGLLRLRCSNPVTITHWGQVTHICISNLIIIGSDNGLSPGRRQAIIWTNAEILLIGPLETNFSEIISENHTFSFKKMHMKMSSGK